MLKQFILLILLAFLPLSALSDTCSPSDTIPCQEGHLRSLMKQSLVKNIISYQVNCKGKKTTAWRAPSAEDITTFIRLTRYLLEGNDYAAYLLAQDINFSLTKFIDQASGNAYYLLKQEKPLHGGGVYIYNPKAPHNVVVEVPHPIFDGYDYKNNVSYTGVEGVDLFFAAPARWLMVSGADRRAGPNHTNDQAYYYKNISYTSTADAAHNLKHYFFAMHYALNRFSNDPLFVQLHGFNKSMIKSMRKTCYSADKKRNNHVNYLDISNGAFPSSGDGVRVSDREALSHYLYKVFREPVGSTYMNACFFADPLKKKCATYDRGNCPYTYNFAADNLAARISNDPLQFATDDDNYLAGNIHQKGHWARVDGKRFFHIEQSTAMLADPKRRAILVQKISQAIQDFYVARQ